MLAGFLILKGLGALLSLLMSQVVNALPAVSVEAVEEHGGLPCEFYPSDHLSIAVDLRRKQ